ncbi:MAG: LamG-like jellyroll fold domain-containing protein [Candidatus Pacearchaeota archaeon]
MQKRGLSEVIVSLIIILLVLVAVGIVWIIVKNILTGTSEQITIDPLTNNIKIEEAKVGLLTAKIKLTRTQGNAELTSFKFVFSDGTKTYEYEEKNNLLQTLETKTYEISLSDGIKPTSVIVIPIFGKTDGTEVSIIPTIDYTSTMNNGLVAYYKFDGDAKDSSGNGNDGTCLLATCPILKNGKIGQAYYFDGFDDYILVKDSDKLSFGDSSQDFPFTIIWWQNSSVTPNLPPPLMPSNNKGFAILGKASEYSIEFSNKFRTRLISGGTSYYIGRWGDLMKKDLWTQIAVTYDASKVDTGIKFYQDGSIAISTSESSTIPYIALQNTNNNLTIGKTLMTQANGTIDELIIFNRALSDLEIKQIYDSQK